MTDENGLKMLARHDYLLTQDPKALKVAKAHYKARARACPLDIVELIELRDACVVVECGVLKTTAE